MRIKSIPTEYSIQDRDLTEQRDCAVRAYAAAFSIPYAEAKSKLALWGRKDRKATYGTANFIMQSHPELKPITPKQTLAMFAATHSGTWFVLVRGHAICIKNGKNVSDFFQVKAGKRVTMAWQTESVKAILYKLVINGQHEIKGLTLQKASELQKDFQMMKNHAKIERE